MEVLGDKVHTSNKKSTNPDSIVAVHTAITIK